MALVLNGSGITSANIADGTITTDDILASDVSSLKSGRKNLIINGGFDVWQRGTSIALTASSFLADRFRHSLAGATTARFTVSKSTDAPTGFSNSVKWDCTTALATMDADDAIYDDYKFEGQDVQHLAYGEAGAKTITLSFWVKSNKTGTYVVWFYMPDGTRHSAITYTVDTADTWEKKTGTITGNTTQLISNASTAGLYVRFVYAAGSTYTSGTQVTSWVTNTNADRYAAQTVNLADSTANYINITAVQLELGSVATDFEHRSYGEELALCQRYYYKAPTNGDDLFIMVGVSVTVGEIAIFPPVSMRTTPSAILNDASPYWESHPWNAVGNNAINISSLNVGHISQDGVGTLGVFFSGTTGAFVTPNLSRGINYGIVTNFVSFDAEL